MHSRPILGILNSNLHISTGVCIGVSWLMKRYSNILLSFSTIATNLSKYASPGEFALSPTSSWCNLDCGPERAHFIHLYKNSHYFIQISKFLLEKLGKIFYICIINYTGSSFKFETGTSIQYKNFKYKMLL